MKFKFFLFLLFLFNIHSYLTAQNEYLPKKLRLFSIDIHGSPSADVNNIFNELGYEVTHWPLGGYSNFSSENTDVPTEILNLSSWFSGDLNIYGDFREKYKDFLSQFDAFIVYNSSMALLYENLNKPIIIVEPLRYEYPFLDKPVQHKLLNNYLIDSAKSNILFYVCNNKADKKYLKYYTGLTSEHIPSLCLYTKAQYKPTEPFFICHQTCNRENSFSSFLAQKYPNLINNDIKIPYQWQDLYSYKGIIHFPYQISTMSIFEQYSANVPLFFPSKKFLKKLRTIDPSILNEVSTLTVIKRARDLFELNYQSITPSLLPGDLNNLEDPTVIQFWIDNADFYDEKNMPFIQYFDSFEHLEHLLQTVNLEKISKQMKKHNIKRKARILKKWRSILNQVEKSILNDRAAIPTQILNDN